MKALEDPEWETKVGTWVEAVLEEELPGGKGNLFPSMKNGILLCRYISCSVLCENRNSLRYSHLLLSFAFTSRLMNKIKPGSIPKFNTKLFRGKLHPLSERVR